MSPADLVLFEEDFHRLNRLLRKLRVESGASVVLLVDKNGQRIASVGDVDSLDLTALASLPLLRPRARLGRGPSLGELRRVIAEIESER